jgi:hypothetical protein
VVYGTSSLLLLPFLFKDGLQSFLVWTIIRTMIIVLLVEDAIPFSFLMMASAPAATSASAAAPSASATAPLVQMWWTRRAGDLALGVSLWIGTLQGVFAVKDKNVPRIGVRGVSGIGPFPLARLISFCGLLLLRLLFHAHLEIIVRATILLELFV